LVQEEGQNDVLIVDRPVDSEDVSLIQEELDDAIIKELEVDNP